MSGVSNFGVNLHWSGSERGKERRFVSTLSSAFNKRYTPPSAADLVELGVELACTVDQDSHPKFIATFHTDGGHEIGRQKPQIGIKGNLLTKTYIEIRNSPQTKSEQRYAKYPK